MNLDRFKNFGSDVRDLVLSFEQQPQSRPFFDVEQLEIIADYYLEVADVEGLESAVRYGEQLFPSNSEILLRRAHLLSVTGEYAKSLEFSNNSKTPTLKTPTSVMLWVPPTA